MEMKQLPLLPDSETRTTIVNVASVPQRSPFRYPGGKTWLVPHIRRWLRAMTPTVDLLIEPFAGGGIVGLTAAFEHLAEHVLLAELDDDVAAVWDAIINQNEAPWLAEAIRQFSMTPESVQALLTQPDSTTRVKALKTIVKNRINRGGILAPGAGRHKSGENGKGLLSRWYPETLAKRILDIEQIRERLGFVHGDGIEVMRQHTHNSHAAFFIDPPYSASGKRAGKRLYAHFDIDHGALFALAASLSGSFLMTYDDNEAIRVLALAHEFDVAAVPMKNTHHNRLNELLISRDLTWLGE